MDIAHPLRHKQLIHQRRLIDDIQIIQDPRLDDFHAVLATESISIAEHRGPAIRAETIRDGFPTRGDLRDFLGRALQQFEMLG